MATILNEHDSFRFPGQREKPQWFASHPLARTTPYRIPGRDSEWFCKSQLIYNQIDPGSGCPGVIKPNPVPWSTNKPVFDFVDSILAMRGRGFSLRMEGPSTERD